MVEKFLKVKRGLQQMLIDPRWDIYVSKVRAYRERKTNQRHKM